MAAGLEKRGKLPKLYAEIYQVDDARNALVLPMVDLVQKKCRCKGCESSFGKRATVKETRTSKRVPKLTRFNRKYRV